MIVLYSQSGKCLNHNIFTTKTKTFAVYLVRLPSMEGEAGFCVMEPIPIAIGCGVWMNSAALGFIPVWLLPAAVSLSMSICSLGLGIDPS